MDARKIMQFCGHAELTYIETGLKDNHKGHWFYSRDRKRLFYDDDQIHQALERRDRSFFAHKVAR